MSGPEIEKHPCVILYGRSVILGTLGESLKRFPELKVLVLHAPSLSVEDLAALEPDAIILDVTCPRPEAAWALLERCPGLLLVELDPDSNEMVVLSSRSMQALSARDLVKAICSKKPSSETKRR